MTVTRLVPTADGSDDAWTRSGGTSKWGNMALPDDAATTRVYYFGTGAKQVFSHGGLPPDADLISTHTLVMRGSYPSVPGQWTPILKYNSNYTSGVAVGTASFVTYSDVDLAVPGGGTWTAPIVNATEIGYDATAGAEWKRITTLYWDVTHTESVAAGSAWLLSVVMPTLLAMASHAISMADIFRMLEREHHRPSEPWEYCDIMAAFKVRPRYA